jgi:hypothetical protein
MLAGGILSSLYPAPVGMAMPQAEQTPPSLTSALPQLQQRNVFFSLTDITLLEDNRSSGAKKSSYLKLHDFHISSNTQSPP